MSYAVWNAASGEYLCRAPTLGLAIERARIAKDMLTVVHYPTDLGANRIANARPPLSLYAAHFQGGRVVLSWGKTYEQQAKSKAMVHRIIANRAAMRGMAWIQDREFIVDHRLKYLAGQQEVAQRIADRLA